MKQLLLFLALMVASLNTWAACTFDATQPQIELLDENKQVIQGVSKSNTPIKAGTKSSRYCETDVCYGRYDGDITFTYVCDDEPIEPPMPVSCPEGFTGIEPNCEPLPITCTLPYVLNVAENQCYTSDATCQDAGWDKANADLKGCMNEPEPVDPPHNHGTLPHVDTSQNITPAVGDDTLNIVTATDSFKQHPAGINSGEFRINCKVSHMSNDDPIVYPNQEGAAHHHTFFGNTSVNYKSDVGKMDEVGNSTCSGGIANRSTYWFPTMIDTSTHTPIKPDGVSAYYKTDRSSDVTVPPKGLRMVAKTYSDIIFACNDGYPDQVKLSREIPACPQGGKLTYGIEFGNCWDGVNLDSPDHQSHMVKAGWAQACPASHPVRIPNIQVNVAYRPDTPAGTANWRLSSDPEGAIAGSTIHADWVNGWNQDVAATWVNNCLKAERDCHSDLLGDGNMLYFEW